MIKEDFIDFNLFWTLENWFRTDSCLDFVDNCKFLYDDDNDFSFVFIVSQFDEIFFFRSDDLDSMCWRIEEVSNEWLLVKVWISCWTVSVLFSSIVEKISVRSGFRVRT